MHLNYAAISTSLVPFLLPLNLLLRLPILISGPPLLRGSLLRSVHRPFWPFFYLSLQTVGGCVQWRLGL